MKRSWYRFQAQDDPAVVDIHIIDFIGDWIDDYWGFGVTAKQFVDDLAKLPESVKSIRVHINSPGGDVFAGANIANALRDQRVSKGRSVETIVDGIAASAASVVLMAGDPVRISDNGLVMIHNPWTIALGNAAEMRKSAEVLDTLRDTIISTYHWHVELSDDELKGLMDAETWMDADEAIERGFASEKVAGLKASASLDPRLMARLGLKVPEKYAERVKALLAEPEPEPGPPAPASAEAVVSLCKAAELDLVFASKLLEGRTPLEDAKQLVAAEAARLKGERDKAAADQARSGEIQAMCDKFAQTELAPVLIASGISAERARSVIAIVTAKLDKVEIDAGLRPDGDRRRSVIDVRAVYAQRNQLRH